MFHLVQHNLIARNMLNLNMKKSTHPHIWPIYQCRHSIYAVLSTHYELYSIQLQSNHIYFLLSKLVQNLAYLIFSVSLPVLFFTLPYPYLFLNRFYPLIFLYFPSLCPLRPPPIICLSKARTCSRAMGLHSELHVSNIVKNPKTFQDS